TVTQAVIEKVQEVCWQYLRADQLLPAAKREVAKALAEASNEKEIASLKAKIESLTIHLDKVYMDKLSGILDEADFQRIYTKVKADRAALEQRLSQLDRPDFSPAEQVDLAKKLVERFLETASTNRELLVSLIERVELTSDKQIIIKFRFRQLEANS
ncbi:MAG: resolvase, partial [Oscillibacter sp.]|nr:resolvase [Oscillibacter sp.]